MVWKIPAAFATTIKNFDSPLRHLDLLKINFHEKIVALQLHSTFFAIISFQQTRQVSARVTVSRNQAVPLASIIVKGTSMGVSADENGRFSIMVSGLI